MDPPSRDAYEAEGKVDDEADDVGERELSIGCRACKVVTRDMAVILGDVKYGLDIRFYSSRRTNVVQGPGCFLLLIPPPRLSLERKMVTISGHVYNCLEKRFT